MSASSDQLAVDSDANEQPSCASRVIELSKRVPYQMHNTYYDHAKIDHFWIQWRFAVIQQLLADHACQLGERVLEIGCGNGVVQSQFEQAYGMTVDGCDLNWHALQRALPTRGKQFLYNVLDQRPEWESHFSSILLLDTLEHIPSPIAFLQAIGAHLQVGGLLILNVPATPLLYSRYDAVQGHVCRYTATRLKRELAAAGFEIVACRYWGANLVPVAMLRKLLVHFANPATVMERGFAPPGRIVEWMLRGCWALERRGFHLRGGTSLAAIAQYNEPASAAHNHEDLGP